MLEKFDDDGVSDLMTKGVFIMDFEQFLVHKIEWKRVLRVWKKVNMCKWFRVYKWRCTVSGYVRDWSVEEG